jgi:hypothetical protein
MIEHPTTEWTELAHRVNHGIDVMLLWVNGDGVDETIVSVYDTREGTYFEIPASLDRAYDVYNHPFAYLDPEESEPRRLAA